MEHEVRRAIQFWWMHRVTNNPDEARTGHTPPPLRPKPKKKGLPPHVQILIKRPEQQLTLF